MKSTTLVDVYNAFNGSGGEELVMSDELIKSARRCIDKMIELGR